MKNPQFSFLSLAFAVSATLSLACSSSGSGSPATTGTGGSDGGSSAALCAMDMGTTLNTISDFETGDNSLIPQQGRNGGWYTYNDFGVANATGAGTSACAETPAPHLAFSANPIDGGRCASTFGLHITGSNCTAWGAGVGTDFAAPVATDGGSTTTTAAKIPYDVTQTGKFTGLQFWGKSGMGALSLLVKFPMTDDTKVIDGGKCMATEVGSDKCSDDYGQNVALTAAWKLYKVPFAGLKQGGWGKMFTWTPTDVTSVQMQVPVSIPFDFWIDDVSFY
jgi:hypothetical protein